MRRTTRTGGIRFATRNNARIAYDPGESASGADLPVAVMLHALLTDHSEFAGVRDQLARRYRVILPDARGHGASPSLQNQWYSVAELAADVLAVLDAEEIEAAHLVGHELGGTTAFDVALRFPERVRTLTLIEPELGAVLDDEPRVEIRAARAERRAGDRAAGDAAYKQLVDRSLDGFLVPRWGKDWRSAVTKPRMGAIRRHAASLAGILPALDAYTVLHRAAADLAVPTLVVVPENADALGQATATRLEGWLQHVEVRSVPLSGPADGIFQERSAMALAGVLTEFWSVNEE